MKNNMLNEAIILLLLFSVARAIDISPMAPTQQGIYIGRQATINGRNVNYWYGIPYAQQPVGHPRWMPPQALGTFNDTKTANIGVACIQRYDFGFFYTEACLTLNVYAPENASHLPVFVWIHGGGFYADSSMQYDATPLVIKSMNNAVPAIVVTIKLSA